MDLKAEVKFRGMGENNMVVAKYPSMRYHKDLPPLQVNNFQEDQEAIANGYEEILDSMIANKQLMNWFWDIEDMSPRQLVVFAREEYGVELPPEASQTTLIKAVLDLSRYAPQNQGRMALMAHEIRLNYDETIEEIKREMTGKTETETFEVVL